MATANIGLEEIALSDTFGQWLEAFNANMDAIDGLPIPIAYGKNTTMEYLKLSSGTIVMWGHFSHGTKYKCTNTLIPGQSYASEPFTIDWPIALTNNTPVVLTSCMDSQAIECEVHASSVSYTTGQFKYYCPSAESSSSTRTKTCDILVIGKWK